MCSNCSGDYEDPEMTAETDDQPDLQTLLERCHTISLMQQRIRASNDSRLIEASNANSRALIEALRGSFDTP